jgi:hypothetical protein
MIDIGSVIVTPTSPAMEVGDFSLAEGDNALWIEATQISPTQAWNYSYGLLWWESTEGRELGTTKVYGHEVGETYLLGVGKAPTVRTGKVFFQTRAYNRRWISIDNPPRWSLSFRAASGVIGSRSSVGAVSNSLVRDTDGSGLSFVQVNFS